jgi:hypothetical protein
MPPPDLDEAFRELRLLLTRRPARSAPWRAFWALWLPTMAAMGIATGVLGIAAFSLGGLGVLAGGVVFALALQAVLERAGVVGPRRRG